MHGARHQPRPHQPFEHARERARVKLQVTGQIPGAERTLLAQHPHREALRPGHAQLLLHALGAGAQAVVEPPHQLEKIQRYLGLAMLARVVLRDSGTWAGCRRGGFRPRLARCALG